MKIDYQKICADVCLTARRAGEYIAQQRKNFSADKIEYKGEQNLVSYVDKTAEAQIIRELLAILPNSGIIAEESTPVTGGDFTWIIDPLDGTTNFTHGIPPYCVSIALMEGDEVVVGVIYEICCNECFYAYKGSGCYLNGELVRVSGISTIEKSLVITGLAYKVDNIIEGFRRSFDYFNLNSNGARRLGSAASDLAYVAAGRAECFYQANLSPWDVAAGAFLVERAGGVVVDFNGGRDFIFGKQIIATNTAAHTIFFEKLKELL